MGAVLVVIGTTVLVVQMINRPVPYEVTYSAEVSAGG